MIITQTVGQMTDKMPCMTIATQTPLPRTHLSFASLAASNIRADQRSSPFEKQMLENDLLLQTQRNALKILDKQLNETYFNECHQRNINLMKYENVMSNDKCPEITSQNHSPSVPVNTMQNSRIDKIAEKMVLL